MDTVRRLLAGLLHAVRSRIFGVAVLAVASTAMVMCVTVNMHAITVIDGNTSHVILTMNNDDPHAVLEAVGVALSDGDEVQSSIQETRGEIEISRAFDVQVTADGVSTALRMTTGTVQDALEKVGVEVGEDDVVNYAYGERLRQGMNIQVERVEYTEFTRTEAIPYETVVKYTNVYPKGTGRIRQAGQDGVKTYVYRSRVVEGETVSTELVSETVTKEPVDEIKLMGSVAGTPLSQAPFEIELDEAGQPLEYKAVYTGTCTAYTCDGGRLSNKTASGLKPQVGVVGVDPKKFPYGTKLYITSADGSYVYGYAIAGDCGGGTENGSLIADLYMDTYEECIQFGKRSNFRVYVLEWA